MKPSPRANFRPEPILFGLTSRISWETRSPFKGITRLVLTLRNISRLDLISPRDNEEVPNSFPLFQWIYDGTTAEISIYERLPQHQSKEEAAQGTPHLLQEISGARLFQYPSTASRSLEAGKTYVWKVRGLTTGSGGSGASINSEIWQFVVSAGGSQNTSSLSSGGGSGQSFINLLMTIPGIPPEVINQLVSGNLQLTGFLSLNGSPVSAAQLNAILNDLSQNPDKIIETTSN